LFNYPEKLLGCVRGDKMEWYTARHMWRKKFLSNVFSSSSIWTCRI
jgi:hypothetical protein